jgi:hypothetical protein
MECSKTQNGSGSGCERILLQRIIVSGRKKTHQQADGFFSYN